MAQSPHNDLFESLNRKVLRRTRVATIFPNDSSLLGLVSAVLVEVSHGWGRNAHPHLKLQKGGCLTEFVRPTVETGGPA